MRQNLSAIFGSRAGSFRCRRSRANKEEEVGGIEKPGLTDSMPGLPHPSRHVCTVFYFAAVISQPSSIIPSSPPFPLSAGCIIDFFSPHDGCDMIHHFCIFVLSCKMSQIKLPCYKITMLSFSCVSKAFSFMFLFLCFYNVNCTVCLYFANTFPNHKTSSQMCAFLCMFDSFRPHRSIFQFNCMRVQPHIVTAHPLLRSTCQG